MSQFGNTHILQRAVESSITGIVIADCTKEDMPLMYVNQAFLHMTGYTVEECVGKNCRFL